ncbi:MAG: NAD(P)H-dependent oxidoreductase subunit E [Robiginitomaculum sp.]
MSDQTITQICDTYNNQPDGLIEILHEVQSQYHYLSKEALIQIAGIINISRADIHGIVSFYDGFRRSPPKGNCIKICRAEACQAVGGEDLAAHAKNSNIETHDVYCLGNCALGPAVMIDEDLYGRVTPEKLDAIIKRRAAS